MLSTQYNIRLSFLLNEANLPRSDRHEPSVHVPTRTEYLPSGKHQGPGEPLPPRDFPPGPAVSLRPDQQPVRHLKGSWTLPVLVLHGDGVVPRGVSLTPGLLFQKRRLGRGSVRALVPSPRGTAFREGREECAPLVPPFSAARRVGATSRRPPVQPHERPSAGLWQHSCPASRVPTRSVSRATESAYGARFTRAICLVLLLHSLH